MNRKKYYTSTTVINGNSCHNDFTLVGVVAVEMPLNEAFTTMTAAFAKAGNNYESNQSLNPMNECGNGNFPLDVLCKNLGSEVYGNMNSENLPWHSD